MSDPTFAEYGTLVNRRDTYSMSLTSTIQNVAVGDLLVAHVQRNTQTLCTGVASDNPALTFTLARRATSGSNSFGTDIWLALATTAAASMQITANYSSTDQWACMYTVRYSPGVSSVTPHKKNSYSTLRSSSTNRTAPNITTTVRTLLIAAGTNWNDYNELTPRPNWTERVDNNAPFGAASTYQFLFDRIADAGTYPSGNYATNAAADQYTALIIALPVIVGPPPGIPLYLGNTRVQAINEGSTPINAIRFNGQQIWPNP